MEKSHKNCNIPIKRVEGKKLALTGIGYEYISSISTVASHVSICFHQGIATSAGNFRRGLRSFGDAAKLLVPVETAFNTPQTLALDAVQ